MLGLLRIRASSALRPVAALRGPAAAFRPSARLSSYLEPARRSSYLEPARRSSYLETPDWGKHYLRLAQHRADTGSCAVPHGLVLGDGTKLGTWVSKQRKSHKTGVLSKDRVQRLDAIGFTWDLAETTWMSKFDALRDYKEQFGDVSVPYHFVSESGGSLGRWVISQRQSHDEGKMTPARVELLDSLGFSWGAAPSSRRESTSSAIRGYWPAQCLVLEAYFAEHGHSDVPLNFVSADGTKLGRWTKAQRRAHDSGKLSQARILRLEKAGFVWSAYAGKWEAHYNLLQALHEARGKCGVPTDFLAGDGINMVLWFEMQRTAYKNKRLTPDRILRLDEVGFVWHVSTNVWDAFFELLQPYRAQHGDFAVPFRFVAADGTRLGRWVAAQRHAHNAGKLRPERIERLEAAGFNWSTLADCWDAHFELLQDYRAEHGHCGVPQRFAAADGITLGAWVGRQRTAYKAGKLSPERIERLEAVGFAWQQSRHKAGKLSAERVERLEAVEFLWRSPVGLPAAWDASFEALQAFQEAHGNRAVPQNFAAADGTNLGLWVDRQRKAYNAGKMGPERVERLEAVKFVWDPLAHMWDANFEVLQAYHEAKGDCRVPKGFAAADGTKLGSWVATQRKAYKAGKLSPERVERLGAVGFVWQP
ncbi:helicase associated domain-containing protein [Pelagophyceae sp. CCMP2097]|nr:helicase associated domain-containing protein [Pelagophyceae sp. CCMP2097]